MLNVCNKYKTATILLVLVCNTAVFSQEYTSNIAKYWYYRSRLDYFVVPGEKQGESQIVCVRNKTFSDTDPLIGPVWGGKNVDYGQHGKYTGLYWGVLATEYYLLQSYGRNEEANRTLSELYLALRAYIEHMDKCEEVFPTIYNSSFDGFFIREAVPCGFLDPAAYGGIGLDNNGVSHRDRLNKRLMFNNTYDENNHYIYGVPNGHPGYVDHRTGCSLGASTELGSLEAMSQDEAFMILMGCALTVKLAEGTICYQPAWNIADKVVRYIINLDDINGPDKWKIYHPVTHDPVDAGAYTYTYGKGIVLAGEAITGEDYGTYDPTQVWLWGGFRQGPLGTDNDQMVLTLAAIGDSWVDCGDGIVAVAGPHEWHTFYVLLWEVLHEKRLNELNQGLIIDKAKEQLDLGPCEGPYSFLDRASLDPNNPNEMQVHSGINTGWGSTYRWCKGTDEQYHGDWYWGVYSGTDYMLLYNLYHIINMGDEEYLPFYTNYKDRVLEGTMPMCLPPPFNPSGPCDEFGTINDPRVFIGFNTLESSQIIDNVLQPGNQPIPGDITYKAEMSITLKPGFHVAPGAYFHAYLGDIDCSVGDYRVSNQYPDNVVMLGYDQTVCSSPKAYQLNYDQSYNTDERKAMFEFSDLQIQLNCYPNPFTENITINFILPQDNNAYISIKNELGVEIESFGVIQGYKGVNTIKFNTSSLPSGNYIILFHCVDTFISKLITKL